jgi:hypothetical protein
MLLPAAFFAQAQTASYAAEVASLVPLEKWSNVFSGSNVTLRYVVRSADPLDGRLDWSLSVNRRTVQHGQVPLKIPADRAAEIAVPLKVPEVKQAVILKAQLGVAVYPSGATKPAAEHLKTVRIFPRDPFYDRSEWLRELRITLFDPEGKTADVLEKARVPVKLTKNITALDDLIEGVLLIGEGTALRDHRGLGEAMVKAATRGVPVLCLAPGEGSMILPGSEGEYSPRPASLTLRQNDIITDLDKRLDAAAWMPCGRIPSSRLAIKSDVDQVVAASTRDGPGWPWLEARYAARRGRLIVCGFPIIRQWEASPTPRYLLMELFRRIAPENESIEKRSNSLR